MNLINFQSWSSEKQQQAIELLDNLKALYTMRRHHDDNLIWEAFTDLEKTEAFAELQAKIKTLETQWDELCTQ